MIKVKEKQKNSRMCMICGLDNESGVKAPFYSMEDGSVMTKFRFREIHQSYPGRVHGGMITAMLDELGLRALWSVYPETSCASFGVTLSLETKFRQPVPYGVELLGRAEIVRNSNTFLITKASIMDKDGKEYASGTQKYIKLTVEKIAENADVNEEMAYLIEDGVKEI